ncbi:MAG: SGNH/GDSL hydrolase family protein [Candidatus Hydrogenedens sp.]|nr:SGNH/GDSL hydrolase family protein [Candidatus Hydrogenedens sp.]
MRALLVLSFVAAALCAPLAQADNAAPALHRERIEWCDIWFTDAEKDALPRVLLIGDSITRGYFPGVESALDGKAYCGRLTTSRSVCDPVFFQELALVLGQYDFAVIHFNNGLHGWDYTEDEYRAGFQRLVDALREQAPKAKLICALTTPVQPSGGMADSAPRVAARNAIATEICQSAGIPLDDLHTPAAEHADHFSGDGVHFNEDGKKAQVKLVAEAVAAALGE